MLSTLYGTVIGVPLMPNLRVKVFVDVALGATMLVNLVTGLVIWLIIPEAQRSGQYDFWGMSKFQ